jgi:hypothetical protein
MGHRIGILVDDLPDRGPLGAPSGAIIIVVISSFDKVFIVVRDIETDLVVIAERLQLEA